MGAAGWDERRRLMALIAICAAVVVIEAFALVIGGGHGRHRPVVEVGAGGQAGPFQAPRSVPTTVPFTTPTTVSPPDLPPVQEVMATIPAVHQASVPVQAAASPAPPTTRPPAHEAPAPAAASAPPVPACNPGDLAVSVSTDQPAYQQHDTVKATGLIRNVSAHDCTARSDADSAWCDGGSTCISQSGPFDATSGPEVWPAGSTHIATDSWAFGQGDRPFTPESGRGKVTFTWHLGDGGAIASGTATFTIEGPPATTTTSTTEAPTTTTTVA